MVIRSPRPRGSSASAETFSSRRVRVLIAYGAGLRWRPVATVVGELGVAVVVLLLLPAFPFKQLLIGFMLGSITMAVTLSIGQVDDPLVHGRWAEQWSVEALRKVKGWRVIDNVPFDHVDVDHVAVTPCGVLAVETKFHSKLSAGLAAEVHARDLAAARAAAAKLRLLLRSFSSQILKLRPCSSCGVQVVPHCPAATTETATWSSWTGATQRCGPICSATRCCPPRPASSSAIASTASSQRGSATKHAAARHPGTPPTPPSVTASATRR